MTKKYGSRNQVQVTRDKHQNLLLQIPGVYAQAYYGKKQKYISFGGKESAENRVLVDQARNLLQLDLETEKFNPQDLSKYQHPTKRVTNKYSCTQPSTEISLLELFDRYCEYKKPQLAETTYKSHYRGCYLNAITKAPQDLKDQLAIQNYLVNTFKPTGIIRLLGAIHQAILWGKREKLIPDDYESNFHIYQDDYKKGSKRANVKRKQPKSFADCSCEPDKIAWTKEQMEIIIDAFHRRRQIAYKAVDYVAYFVEFLFRTGVRHGEAMALTWKDVSDDFTFFRVDESYSLVTKKVKCTKMGNSRKVPCSGRVQEILRVLKQYSSNNDEPIFKNAKGEMLNRKYVRTIWAGSKATGMKSIIHKLILEGKLPQYLDFYSTRRTFISNQIRTYDVKTVADWVGDHPKTILDHYCYRNEDAIPID